MFFNRTEREAQKQLRKAQRAADEKSKAEIGRGSADVKMSRRDYITLRAGVPVGNHH